MPAGRPSGHGSSQIGGLVDLHAEAKFARIEFDGAFYVGDARGELLPIQISGMAQSRYPLARCVTDAPREVHQPGGIRLA